MKLKYLILILSILFLSRQGYSQWTVSTYTGNGSPGFLNGHISSAMFNHPFSMCRDKFGNIFISDSDNHCIRKISGDSVYTYAGTGIAGLKDTLSEYSQFNSPAGLCADDSGNVFVADFENQVIRKISVSGFVSTLAGSGLAGFADGPSDSAKFNYPRGIAIDKFGNLFVGDSWNHRIRTVSSSGYVTTIAGGGASIGVGSVGSWVDGFGASARFYTPCGLAIDTLGNIFVADAYNHRIRKVDAGGVVSTLAGNGPSGQSSGGFVNGGISISELDTPTEVFFNQGTNDILIGDSYNHAVRKLIASGDLSTLAGTGSTGFVNGAGDSATFNFSRGMVSNLQGDSIWVNDYNNHAVRLLIPDSLTSKDIQLEISVQIFPNPATEDFTIRIEGKKVDHLTLTDLSGKVYRKIFLKGRKEVILDSIELNPGIYFLLLSDKENKIIGSKKVLIQRNN